MNVQRVVDKSVSRGYLSPHDEAALERLCSGSRALEVEEYEALVALQDAIAAGRVLAPERSHCINVMEELVWEEVLATLSTSPPDPEIPLDPGDVAAYALNRLKPLYATTEEGAETQRRHADQQLRDEIRAQVAVAMERGLGRPVRTPERRPLARTAGERAVADLVKEALKGIPYME